MKRAITPSLAMVFALAAGMIGAMTWFESPASAQRVVGGQCGICGQWYAGSHSCSRPSPGGGGGVVPGPIVRQPPGYAEAGKLNTLGNEAWKRGDLAAAVGYYRAGLALLPDATWLQNNLTNASAALDNRKGNEAFGRREWVIAISYYQSALARRGGDETYLKNLRLAQDQLAREQARMNESQKIEEAGRRIRSSIDGLADDLQADQQGGSPFDSSSGVSSSAALGSPGLTFVDPSNSQWLFQKPEQGGTVDLRFLDPDNLPALDPEKVRAMPGGPIDTVSLLAMRQYVQRLQFRPDGSEPVTNPADEQAVAQERELLKAVDVQKLMQLSEQEAIAFVIARQHAASNESARAASASVGRAFTDFERQGLYDPSQGVLEQQRTNPGFAAALEKSVKAAAEAELQADRAARREAVELLVTYHTRKDADAALKRGVEEATRQAVERRDRALAAVPRQTLDRMEAELEELRREGVIQPDEDVLERERRDPAFRRRMDEVVRRVTEWESDQERQILSGSIRDLADELGRLGQAHRKAIGRR